MERNPDASGDADFKDPDIRQNRRGFFMPKIFLNEATIKDGWSVIPMLRETPILKTPTFVRIVGVFLCPRFFFK
jgi:hypothetical protein